MTQRFIPDITFLLGPPADPELRERFEKAQQSLGEPSGGQEQLELEPRLPLLLAEREGKASVLSQLFSLILQAPVRVVDPFLSFGRWKGLWVATLQLRPDNVLGPPVVVARLFEESQPSRAAAAALGLVLKLDWVYSTRSLPLDDEAEDDPIGARGEGGTIGRLR